MRFGRVALSEEEDPTFRPERQGVWTFGPRYIWNLSREIQVETPVGKGESLSKPDQAGVTFVGEPMTEGKAPRLGLSDLFQENCLLALIRGLCTRNGINLTDECIRQLRSNDGYSLLGFEFVTADIVDIIPVVKHMHQVYKYNSCLSSSCISC